MEDTMVLEHFINRPSMYQTLIILFHIKKSFESRGYTLKYYTYELVDKYIKRVIPEISPRTIYREMRRLASENILERKILRVYDKNKKRKITKTRFYITPRLLEIFEEIEKLQIQQQRQ